MKEQQNHLFGNLASVLYSSEQIAARVAELGRQISADYAGRDLVLVNVLKGGIVFLADLSRSIVIPHSFDLVGASSYRGATRSSGKITITKDLDLDIRGRHVVLVEDILDSGRTLTLVLELLKLHEPASLEICCLLDKQCQRESSIGIRYTGFVIPDKFVVGYGLDYKELYRNLPCIGVLKPEAIDG
jgi:hypoxanthine phosphoribosyltransferase